jgi:hypothetical protein
VTDSRRKTGWAVVGRVTGALVLYDGRCPIYWLRRIAVEEAERHGFNVGPDGNARVVKVLLPNSEASSDV